MAEQGIAYDKAELRAIIKSFKAMDDEALAQAKEKTSALAVYVQGKIKGAAGGRGEGARRVADGSRVSKSSKIGEISFGFAGQKFSGGATTQQLWAVLNLVQINISNFLHGRVKRGAVRVVGLFIQP